MDLNAEEVKEDGVTEMNAEQKEKILEWDKQFAEWVKLLVFTDSANA